MWSDDVAISLTHIAIRFLQHVIKCATVECNLTGRHYYSVFDAPTYSQQGYDQGVQHTDSVHTSKSIPLLCFQN